MLWPLAGLDPVAENGAEKVITTNFVIKTVDHTADHCLVKHVWQWDAVDDDCSLASTVPVHLQLLFSSTQAG